MKAYASFVSLDLRRYKTSIF